MFSPLYPLPLMYVITGATGNTGSIIAEQLLAAGKSVVVVGRDIARLTSFVAKGATAAVGDLSDADFLAKTFEGATAVYAVIPPKWDLTEPWRVYQDRITAAFTSAIRQARVPYVVTLSSMGAHRPDAGPVSGLGELERQLDAVEGLNVLHLQPGFFMQNFFAQLGLIRQAGIMGYSLQSSIKIPVVHTRDIATVAVQHLLKLDFEGSSRIFIGGPEDLTMNEVATIIGQGLGIQLPYVTFSYEEAYTGMVQAGIPATIAEGYNALFGSLNAGHHLKDYTRRQENTTPTTLAQFVREELAHVYQQS